MLNLKGTDIFLLSKIAKKINLKDIFPKSKDLTGLPKEQVNLITRDIGINLALTIIENIYLAEEEIILLISKIKNISIENTREMDIEDIFNCIKEIFSNEKILSFFKQSEK